MIGPAGWIFDRGDPDVGIFSTGWVHEDCPALDELLELPGFDYGKVTEALISSHLDSECIIQYVQVICGDCQATFLDTQVDYVGPAEPEPELDWDRLS